MAWEALVAFGIVALAAFAVTWVTTSVADVPPSTYVAILAAVTRALGAGYVAASGVSVSELVTTNVGWALAARVVAGLVYGTAEGSLLAALPTIAIWLPHRSPAGRDRRSERATPAWRR